jgi:NAD(P)-dependent dehydrogenase (short-subunit alcohol dehydrogenase family)
MEQRVAIVTGGLRGLGRAMVFGLAREGHHVVAVGHIDADVAEVEVETAGAKPEGQILPLRTRSIMTISTERASTIWRKGTMPQTYSPPATGVASAAATRARPG